MTGQDWGTCQGQGRTRRYSHEQGVRYTETRVGTDLQMVFRPKQFACIDPAYQMIVEGGQHVRNRVTGNVPFAETAAA